MLYTAFCILFPRDQVKHADLVPEKGQSNDYKTCRHDHQETCSLFSAQSRKSQGTHSSVKRHRESTTID